MEMQLKKERNLLKLLSDQECYEGYKKAFETANVHNISADSIAKNGHYGTAVSHLILGTEELTKGLLLFAQSFGINVRNVPGIHLFFSDHVLKHQFAIYVNTMYPTLKLLMGVIRKMHTEIHYPEKKVEYTSVEKAFLSKDEKKLHAAFRNLPELLDWWDEANSNKNKGFYVDYKTSLETPMQVEQKEYDQAVFISNAYKKQLEEIIAVFENMSPEEKSETIANDKKMKFSKFIVPIIEARKKQRQEEKNPQPFNFTVDDKPIYKIGNPAEFSNSEKKTFKELLVKQDKVRNPTIEKINRCALLCVAIVNNNIVSIGAIKPATSFDFNNKHADLSQMAQDYEIELGYCYTEPAHGGKGLSSEIVKLLLSKYPGVKIMASTELVKTNRMVGILERNGFVRHGKEWKSKIHGGDLGLFLSIPQKAY